MVKKGDKYGYISCLPNAKPIKIENTEENSRKNPKENAKENAKKNTKRTTNKTLQEGDIIEFGLYNGVPIKWRVLKLVKTKGKALLLSEDILELLPFNNSGYETNVDYMNPIEKLGHKILGGETYIYTDEIVWADSFIRGWLNTDFFDYAFDEDEQQKILKTNISTTGKKSNNTRGGEDTNDKVFLLSVEEVKKYMYLGNDCVAGYQQYANSWWLRSPGISNESVASINQFGQLDMQKYHFNKLGVRPAINIKI